MGKLYIIYFVLCMVKLPCLQGQTSSVVTLGKNVTIHSNLLDEDRQLYIYLPESYKNSTFQYPVLYLLDAEYEFVPMVGIVEFMSGAGKIPEMIVVGIVNTNRSRDLTPEAPNDDESKKFWGEIGGAMKFKSFIKNELFPFINKEYRTDGYKILRGQSFGGLFGLFDYFGNNPLFNAYILTSPTVRWNENKLFKQLKQFDYNPNDKRKIYLGEAEFDSGTDTGIRDFSQALSNHIYNPTYFNYDFFKGENHYSLVFKASQKGLEFLYKNWKMPHNLLLEGDFETIMSHYEKASEEFGHQMKIPMGQIIGLENEQLRKGNYKKAIEIALKNIELYPNQPETYWHLGDAFLFAEDYKVALKCFEKALEKAKVLDMSDLKDYIDSVRNTKLKLE